MTEHPDAARPKGFGSAPIRRYTGPAGTVTAMAPCGRLGMILRIA